MRGNFRAILIAVIAVTVVRQYPRLCRRLHLTSRIVTQDRFDQWSSHTCSQRPQGQSAHRILDGGEVPPASVAIDAGQSVMDPLLVFPALPVRRATITLSALLFSLNVGGKLLSTSGSILLTICWKRSRWTLHIGTQFGVRITEKLGR